MKNKIIKLLETIRSDHISSHIKRYYKDLYHKIIEETQFLEKNVKISERIYCVINDIIERPKCIECNNFVSFINLKKGYCVYCGHICRSNSKEWQKTMKNIMIIKYGVEHASQSPIFKEKAKKTSQERYGYDHPNKSPDIKKKIESTKLQRYGDPYYWNQKKIETTKLEKYGDVFYNNPEKNKQTKKEKYDDEYYFNYDKCKQTKLERYGNENYRNYNKSQQTKLERYGNENYRNIDKIKTTKKERYGSSGFNNREKAKKTKLEKYGDENYTNRKKMVKTKIERYGTACSYIPSTTYSKISQEFFWDIYNRLPNKLKEKTYFAELNKEFDSYYGDKKQFFYDFVISNIKLCIEFNGDYWHRNPEFYKATEENIKIWENDKVKIGTLEQRDFDVLVVWENDYNKDKNKTVRKCLNHIFIKYENSNHYDITRTNTLETSLRR